MKNHQGMIAGIKAQSALRSRHTPVERHLIAFSSSGSTSVDGKVG
jgi:hypothetical protein